jgi:hypothetical protein
MNFCFGGQCQNFLRLVKFMKKRTVQDALAEVRQGIQKIQEVLGSDLSDEAKLLYICLYLPNPYVRGDGPYSSRNFVIDNVEEQQKTIEAMEELTVKGYFGKAACKLTTHRFVASSVIPDSPPKQYIYILGGIGRHINVLFEPLFPFTRLTGGVALCDMQTPEEHQYILDHPEILRSCTINGQPSLFSRLDGYIECGKKWSCESAFPVLFNRLKNCDDKKKREWMSLFPSLSSYLKDDNE